MSLKERIVGAYSYAKEQVVKAWSYGKEQAVKAWEWVTQQAKAVEHPSRTWSPRSRGLKFPSG